MNETASHALTKAGGHDAPLLDSADPQAADLPVSSVSDWVALLKPRVVMLVVFTGWIGS